MSKHLNSKSRNKDYWTKRKHFLGKRCLFSAVVFIHIFCEKKHGKAVYQSQRICIGKQERYITDAHTACVRGHIRIQLHYL